MAGSYQKSKGRGGDGGFFSLPKRVIDHPNFFDLSPKSIKLMVDLCSQFKGHNNGDLCATWSIMKQRGWRSKTTLSKSIKELNHYGFIVQTQYGGLNRVSLYGFTWIKLDKAAKETGLQTGQILGTWKATP